MGFQRGLWGWRVHGRPFRPSVLRQMPPNLRFQQAWRRGIKRDGYWTVCRCHEAASGCIVLFEFRFPLFNYSAKSVTDIRFFFLKNTWKEKMFKGFHVILCE